jgi:hypothetical protein
MQINIRLDQFQFKALQQPGQDDFGLNLGKGCADANPRAAPEGDKAVGRAGAGLLRGKALGIEAVGVGPVFRQAVGQVGGLEYAASGRDVITAKFQVNGRRTCADV